MWFNNLYKKLKMKVLKFAKLLIFLDKNKKLFSGKNELGELSKDPTEGNLILNKYLHIGQMLYIAEYKKKLFDEDIICFLNGGVVLEVHKKWYQLIKEKEKNLTFEDKYTKFAEKLINILKNFKIIELIEISHCDPSWKKAWSKIGKLKKENKMENMENNSETYKKIFKIIE